MFVAISVGIYFALDPPGIIAVMVGWVGGFLLSASVSRSCWACGGGEPPRRVR